MIEPMQIKWSILEEGFDNLNVDGLRSDKENLAYGRGLLRDAQGKWLGGFMASFDYMTVLKAESRALLVDMHLANT